MSGNTDGGTINACLIDTVLGMKPSQVVTSGWLKTSILQNLRRCGLRTIGNIYNYTRHVWRKGDRLSVRIEDRVCSWKMEDDKQVRAGNFLFVPCTTEGMNEPIVIILSLNNHYSATEHTVRDLS